MASNNPISFGVGRNKIVLQVSEDRYANGDAVSDASGDAEFKVFLDGKELGGLFTDNAIHSQGQDEPFTFRGDFGAGVHSLRIQFINDAWGGTPQTDRNLYVDAVSYNGLNTSGTAALYSNGSKSFSLSGGTNGLSLLGVNLSGAEYGSRTSTYGSGYIYPTDAEIAHYASKGLNVIRLPFLLERVQPTQNGPLNTTELARLDAVVAYAAGKNMKVILDPHNYGRAWGSDIGSANSPVTAFDNFWQRMAEHFGTDLNVVFGLMNEPHDQSGQQWASIAQSSITAIRAMGASQEILVPGTNWDSGVNWDASGNAAALASTISDPLNNFAFEVHQYLDGDSSGTHFTPVSDPNTGAERLAEVTNWAAQTGSKLFLGEVGVPSDAASVAALSNILTYMQQHPAEWQGATYWAGGSWWGTYPFSIEPGGSPGMYTDKPQMAALVAHEGGIGQ